MIPTNVKKSVLIQFGELAREELNIENGYDLRDLVEANNGTIETIGALHEDQYTGLICRPDDSFTIRVSSLSPSYRNNMVVAHELAHVMLHWPLFKEAHPDRDMISSRSVDENDPSQARCYWEARYFAAGFMMPEAEFSALYREQGAKQTSIHLAVSQMAVEMRAKDLGLAAIEADLTPN